MPCVEEFVEVPPNLTASCGNKSEHEEPGRSEPHFTVHPNSSLLNDQATMFVNPQVNEQGLQRSYRSSNVESEHVSDGKMDPGPGPDGDGNNLRTPPTVLYHPSRVKLHWGNVMRNIGPGLDNMGNTCYINSVLQCLTHTPPLANYCISDDHTSECRQKVFCLMCHMMNHIRKAFKKDQSVICPYWVRLKTNENILAKSFRPNKQEDAHEFLRVMVDGLQKACLTESGCSKLDQHSRDTTVVNQIFGGYLQSQVRCMKCSARFNTYDPYMDICLDIKGFNYMEDAFARYVKPETLDLDNAYKCERCLQKVNAEKKLSIHKESNVLTVQLKRFDFIGTAAKIRTSITFSDWLNIRPYMSQNQGEPLWYRLYAVVVHSGSHWANGHYYSYIKSSDGTWYKMNDNCVHPVSTRTVFEDEAYVLFYLRDVSKQQNNHLQKNTPFNGPSNKGWEPKMRFNGAGNRYNGAVSSPMNGGPSGRYTPHGSPVNGTTASQRAAHFTPVNGIIGPQRPPNGKVMRDSGDNGVLRPQQGPSPHPPTQPPVSVGGTALPQGHKKICFDFNKKPVPHSQAPPPHPTQKNDSHVNGMQKVHIVLSIKNGTLTTFEKLSDGKESLVKSSQTRKVPSTLVPYDLDSDSEEGSSSKKTDVDSTKKDASLSSNLLQEQENGTDECSSFTWNCTPASESDARVSMCDHVEGNTEDEKEKMRNCADTLSPNHCDQNGASSSGSPAVPLANSDGVHDTSTNGHTTESENILLNSSQREPFRTHESVHRNVHVRAGSLDKVPPSVKPQKRSSSLEPVQNHSFERTADTSVSASFGQHLPNIDFAKNCSEPLSQPLSQDVQQEDKQPDTMEANKTQEDLSSGERQDKKKKKKRRKNRYNMVSDGDDYRHQYKKKQTESESSNSGHKDRWGRQQESEYDHKRPSDLSYSDYDYQSSSAKRGKSPASDVSEYEWTERTKESLQKEKSAERVRHNGRDGDWSHASIKPEGGERYCNGSAWSQNHSEQRDWKKGDKTWRYPNHQFSGRDRWREDESQSQSSYYSGHTMPSSFSRPHNSSDHQSGSFHHRNNTSSSSSHHYYRDQHHNHNNSFSNGSHYNGSRRSYNNQRRY